MSSPLLERSFKLSFTFCLPDLVNLEGEIFMSFWLSLVTVCFLPSSSRYTWPEMDRPEVLKDSPIL